jgi:hypothetical protein
VSCESARYTRFRQSTAHFGVPLVPLPTVVWKNVCSAAVSSTRVVGSAPVAPKVIVRGAR